MTPPLHKIENKPSVRNIDSNSTHRQSRALARAAAV